MSKGIAWTEKEKQYVIDNYKKMSAKKMAEHIGKTEYAVCNFKRKLKYKKFDKKINVVVSKKKVKVMQTLCWTCSNACNNGCSWSYKLKPVKDWTARETDMGYLIEKCPEYIKEVRK